MNRTIETPAPVEAFDVRAAHSGHERFVASSDDGGRFDVVTVDGRTFGVGRITGQIVAIVQTGKRPDHNGCVRARFFSAEDHGDPNGFVEFDGPTFGGVIRPEAFA